MSLPGGSVLQRKCACGGSAGLTGECEACKSKKLLGQPLQRKLAISEPGDQYEQEADRVAEQVTRMADGESIGPLGQSIPIGEGVVGRRPLLQRAEEAAGTAATEGEKPKEEGSRCPSWRGDPQSISKRAGEFYARNHLTPPSQATVERIECEPPRSNGNYGCYVHFSDGLVLRVIVRETDIVVGTGPGPITTLHPPPATPLCWYEYSCPEGDLVLTVKKCQSAKPSGSSGPPAVAQRAAASGARSPMTAPPIVQDVLNSPGQPLDAATRSFFESRFGHDFGRVRVHTDERAEQSASAVNAHAYSVGRSIVFGAGQFSPETREGRRLLAHELTHLLQQTQLLSPSMDRVPHSEVSKGKDQTGQIARHPSGAILQREPKPTGIVLKEAHPFGHADLKGDEDKKKFRTYIGSTTLMQVTPAADYKGHCTKEYLAEVANTCPARFSELRKETFCTESKCLDFDRYGSSGDPQTGKMVTDGPDTFIDRHRTRHPDSLLEGTGKNECSVVCHQKYKFDRKDDLGSFYVIRNFRADKYTPPGEKAALHITTGEVQKVSAGLEAPSREKFAKDIAPGLKKSGVLLEAPPVPEKAQDKK